MQEITSMSQPYFTDEQFIANVFNSSSCSNELAALKWPLAVRTCFEDNSSDTNPICKHPAQTFNTVQHLNQGFFPDLLSEHLKNVNIL